MLQRNNAHMYVHGLRVCMQLEHTLPCMEAPSHFVFLRLHASQARSFFDLASEAPSVVGGMKGKNLEESKPC